MSRTAVPGYAFGDSALARERLAIVADTFEVPTRTLLADLPALQPRYVLDMGCGPGHTSALLRQRFPHSEVTGVDASPAMIDEARDRVTGAWFCVADVTEPLRLPADVVYARLLLGHLPDPRAALEHWVRA
ncbi:MAG TPA: methyltransferase domain-containing protein, partial [Acidimicrobiia bacterium]|nr:methyltransferase domain-containing protein [Acidimicrobiia bacterium]